MFRRMGPIPMIQDVIYDDHSHQQNTTNTNDTANSYDSTRKPLVVITSDLSASIFLSQLVALGIIILWMGFFYLVNKYYHRCKWYRKISRGYVSIEHDDEDKVIHTDTDRERDGDRDRDIDIDIDIERDIELDPVCRICHYREFPNEINDELIAPCRCSGVIKFIHRGCLDELRRTSILVFLACPICKFAYITTIVRPTHYKSYIGIVLLEMLLFIGIAEFAIYLFTFTTRWIDSAYNNAMRNEFPSSWDPAISDHLAAWFVFLVTLGFVVMMIVVGKKCREVISNPDNCCPDNYCHWCVYTRYGNGNLYGACSALLIAIVVVVLFAGLISVIGGIWMFGYAVFRSRIETHNLTHRARNEPVRDFNGKNIDEEMSSISAATAATVSSRNDKEEEGDNTTGATMAPTIIVSP